MSTEDQDPDGDVIPDNEDMSTDSPTDAGSKESAGSVKVPEAFQKAVTALVQGCQTEACLDFLMAECTEKRKSLMSSQKKSGESSDMMLSDAQMPE